MAWDLPRHPTNPGSAEILLPMVFSNSELTARLSRFSKELQEIRLWTGYSCLDFWESVRLSSLALQERFQQRLAVFCYCSCGLPLSPPKTTRLLTNTLSISLFSNCCFNSTAEKFLGSGSGGAKLQSSKTSLFSSNLARRNFNKKIKQYLSDFVTPTVYLYALCL